MCLFAWGNCRRLHQFVERGLERDTHDTVMVKDDRIEHAAEQFRPFRVGQEHCERQQTWSWMGTVPLLIGTFSLFSIRRPEVTEADGTDQL